MDSITKKASGEVALLKSGESGVYWTLEGIESLANEARMAGVPSDGKLHFNVSGEEPRMYFKTVDAFVHTSVDGRPLVTRHYNGFLGFLVAALTIALIVALAL